MTDTTTRARALIEAATPLPWELTRYQYGCGRFSVGNTLVADVFNEGDRELIAKLPALLNVAEALERILDHFAPEHIDKVDGSTIGTQARAALSKLRESE